jgi:hypothetical protein
VEVKKDDDSSDSSVLWLLQTRVFAEEGATGFVIPTHTLDGEIGFRSKVVQA